MFCRVLTVPSKLSSGFQIHIFDEGVDYNYFSTCCPRDSGDTQYSGQRDCSPQCYTSNITVAESFSTCVNETAKVAMDDAHKAGKLNDTARAGEYWGRCEYIDYEKLQKGVWSKAPPKYVWSLSLLVAVVSAGMFVLGGDFI